MGKQGPCHHCGITSTPLWRNGPPEKPILCNACGSRWRTKGTLTNYTPLHARENVDLKEIKLPKVKPVDHTKLHKRKPVESINLPAENEQEHEGEVTISDQNFQKALEEDTSNRSSSGSAISYSESCSHFGGAEGSEPAGAAQQNAWDSVVPSRKRTCVGRLKQSSVEKLTRDLHSILHQQASYNSESPEDDLLYSAETLFGSVEIGNGGVLLRHPNKATMEEESEASSLPVDNKFSGFSSLPVNSIGRDFITERVKRAAAAEEHASREKASLERFSLLRSKDSPLTRVDLTEVVNLEVFVKHLTPKDQQQLMKYMPPIDAAGRPEDLRDMFHSPQFTENLFHYQQLLLEGTFDMSNSCVTADECRTLKKLVLGSSMKAKWVEYHEKIKGPRNDEDKRRKGARKGVGSSSSFPLGRLDNRPRSNPPEKSSMKSPKRSNKLRVSTLYSPKSVHANSMENTFSFSPRACSFASPFQFNSEGSYLKGEEDEEEDLLMDVRPNGSFPDAELLSHTWKQDAGLNSISAESGVESASCNPTSSSSSQPLKRWGS